MRLFIVKFLLRVHHIIFVLCLETVCEQRKRAREADLAQKKMAKEQEREAREQEKEERRQQEVRKL